MAYQNMMETLREGPFVTFLVELMALISLKDTKHVHDVIKHAKDVVHFYVSNNLFKWLKWPLIQVVQDVTNFIAVNETDVVQSHAKMMYRILLERREALAEDLNNITDYAQSLYDPWEGKNLFDAVKSFGEYPNSKNDGYWTCNNLIEAFLSPMHRLREGEARGTLIEMVNDALLARFPQYKIEDLRRFSGESDELDRDQAHSTREDSSEKTKHIQGKRIKKRKNSKRHNRQKRRHRKTNLESTTQSRNYRRQYRPRTEYEYPLLRHMKPITVPTTIQRRYHIVTSNYHFRQMNYQLPTTRHYVNLMTRPTKSMSDDKKRYAKKAKIHSKVSYKRRMNNDDDRSLAVPGSMEEVKDKALFYHKMKERFKAMREAKIGKMKAEMLKKVVEGSSYSDEEEDLKKKLVQALVIGNKTVGVSSTQPKL
ncbi:hypothetical protein B5X24_HaOG211778 [Helicoverpa armigera]|uniref:Uncharacterized protein n=1 Tax=Helicoverpa armigera TaxID=29058 RepID=A0A2W1BAU2_HELAM|nr:hypothetical protein B5X24_HaOG211778 [Helicoverpa armigera]